MSRKQPIGRIGSFLYRLDKSEKNEASCNLWSCRVEANNGNSERYALNQAKQFAATDDLIAALESFMRMDWRSGPTEDQYAKGSRALAKARGEAT